MPDFSQKLFYHCKSAENFETRIQGSRLYTVSYRASNPGPYQYNWFCSCDTYKFSNKEKHKHCKHIERAKEQQCGWMQFTDGGEPTEYEGRYYCPKCDNRAESRYWGV